MSDEEKRTSPQEEPTGVIRWEGPKSRQWPQVLRVPEPGAEPETEPAPTAETAADLPDMEEATIPLSGDLPEDFLEESAPEGTQEEAVPEPAAEEGQNVQPPAGTEHRAAPAKKNGKKPKKTRNRRKTAEPELDPWEEERNYRPIRARRDGRIGCLGGLMYAVFVISASIVLAVFAWMAASDVLALNKTANTVEVTLPTRIFSDKQIDVKDEDGNVTGQRTVTAADMNAVAGILKDYGLINYKWLFTLYSSFSNAELQLDPGTYELTTNLDYRALVKKMQAGADSQLQTLVMFPEGYNMDQTFARLEEFGVCSAEALYEAAASAEFSYAFLEGAEPGDPYRLEGFLFPDTYYFYQGMQASSAINKFLSNMHYHVTDEMWQRTNAMNLTFHQAVTVASLIEREAADDSERALIASVIYNRLNAGMNLSIDSTVLYALRNTEITRLTAELIESTDSPYNTYLNIGLPPGPICNPGMSSIEAALNPAESRYLYYALDTETGTHRFFTNAEEHLAFVETQDYG